MNRLSLQLMLLLAVLTLFVGSSCSHKFDPDTLDLDFYQWNLWYDTSDESGLVPPSCGWDELHRGKGKLVRIPAMAVDHFPGEGSGGVLWYHCRFTLPENWEDRLMSVQINGAGPAVELFLNQERIAEYSAGEDTFEMDVSDRIYYTLDNHLALKIRIKEAGDWNMAGIEGGVLVKSKPHADSQLEKN